MVHFLRNLKYTRTACLHSKDLFTEEQLSTSHTLVTCPECLLYLLKWKQNEVEFIQNRLQEVKAQPIEVPEGTTPQQRKRGPKPFVNKTQMGLFDVTESINRRTKR